MMNARLVWFFGRSCAGKATLIREVVADLPRPTCNGAVLIVLRRHLDPTLD